MRGDSLTTDTKSKVKWKAITNKPLGNFKRSWHTNYLVCFHHQIQNLAISMFLIVNFNCVVNTLEFPLPLHQPGPQPWAVFITNVLTFVLACVGNP